MIMKKKFTALFMFLAICLLSSCGASRTSVNVRNNADGTSTTIDVKNGNGGSTEVKVAPKVQLDSINLRFLNNNNK